jgi:hypothetical protein
MAACVRAYVPETWPLACVQARVVPATEADLVEKMIDAAARELPRRCQICIRALFTSVLLLVACLFLWFILGGIMYKDPNYFVAIAAVSGLDPATDLGRRPVLDLEFNLTVAVVPQSDFMHVVPQICVYL